MTLTFFGGRNLLTPLMCIACVLVSVWRSLNLTNYGSTETLVHTFCLLISSPTARQHSYQVGGRGILLPPHPILPMNLYRLRFVNGSLN